MMFNHGGHELSKRSFRFGPPSASGAAPRTEQMGIIAAVAKWGVNMWILPHSAQPLAQGFEARAALEVGRAGGDGSADPSVRHADDDEDAGFKEYARK